ncbi:hypothetical protein GC101_18125 [Paenibacillus sp. LMG 31459]|uniref:WxL domain-containing protein n=1 Tax=Paenibacillus phytohabitans TaxID=2654978 RepID=A0ABX1YIM4_9BACL|nr:hypothetical protein [Paenibacillus phytohabitans]NOU80782.1 hypothetical protein [Paenibacillus phytohabitans]
MKKSWTALLLIFFLTISGYFHIGSITKIFADNVEKDYSIVHEENLEISVMDEVYQSEKNSVITEVYAAQFLKDMPSTVLPIVNMSGLTISKTLTVEIGNSSETGWQYDISMQDFDVIRSYSDNRYLTASFPSSYVAYTVTDLEVSEGSPEEIFLGSGVFSHSQTVLQAPEGSGKGRFRATINLNISVPALLDIKNAQGMSVSEGQIGMLTGSYSSTMTCTLVSGI